ncbi:hypothetical protein MTO96_031282 [Rhipicephalus appendiculatus]
MMNRKVEWKKKLPQVVLAINATKHRYGGYSPFRLMHGYDPKLPGELNIASVEGDIDESQRLHDLAMERTDTGEKLQQIQRESAARYDEKRREPAFLIGSWTPTEPLPQLAYNVGKKKTMTYLTEATIVQLACHSKQFYLNLEFALAAYDVNFDDAPPCLRLGFQSSRVVFNRIKNLRKVMNFLKANYTSVSKNFECLLISIG